MAHNLTIREDGFVEMAYVGASPWHRLGNRLGENLTTSKDMMAGAGLDWEVEPRAVFYRKVDANGFTEQEIDSHVVNVRVDTQAPLGIVSKDYKAIQNREAFALMDAIVGEASAMYDTAGSLRGGRKVWALAKLPVDLVVIGDDVIRQHLLLINDHGGDGALMCGFAAERAVCENTVNANLMAWEKGITNMVRVRHTGDVKHKAEEARRILGISLRYFEVAGEVFRAMSQKSINETLLKAYFGAVIPLPKEPDSLASMPDLEAAKFKLQTETVKATHLTLAHLFVDGAGQKLPGAAGTVWGAYNAVTEYVDHVRPAKRGGGERKGGAEAALFGEGQQIRQRAFDEAVALLG